MATTCREAVGVGVGVGDDAAAEAVVVAHDDGRRRQDDSWRRRGRGGRVGGQLIDVQEQGRVGEVRPGMDHVGHRQRLRMQESRKG